MVIMGRKIVHSSLLPSLPPFLPPSPRQGLPCFPSLADVPLVEVWSALRHADMFLYAIARRKTRRRKGGSR